MELKTKFSFGDCLFRIEPTFTPLVWHVAKPGVITKMTISDDGAVIYYTEYGFKIYEIDKYTYNNELEAHQVCYEYNKLGRNFKHQDKKEQVND